MRRLLNSVHSKLAVICLVRVAFVLLAVSRKVVSLSVVDWNAYNERDINGPGTYSFGYDIDDPDSGNTQFRQEERMANGTVTGSYGLLEPDGNVRIVHYVADELGYRVTIENSLRQEQNYPRPVARTRPAPPTARPEGIFDFSSPNEGTFTPKDEEAVRDPSNVPDEGSSDGVASNFNGNDNALPTASPAMTAALQAQRNRRRPPVHEFRRRPSSNWSHKHHRRLPPNPLLDPLLQQTVILEQQAFQPVQQQGLEQSRDILRTPPSPHRVPPAGAPRRDRDGHRDLYQQALPPIEGMMYEQTQLDHQLEQNRKPLKGKQRKKVSYTLAAIARRDQVQSDRRGGASLT